MSLSFKDKRDYWNNIGNYYVYGECIECRSSTLRCERAHIEFYNNVYPYVQQIFEQSATHVTLKAHEKNLWKYACQAQNRYFLSLRDLVKVPSAIAYSGERFSEDNPVTADLCAVREGYKILTDLDGQKCKFDSMLHARNPSCYLFPREELNEIGILLSDLNQTHSALDGLAKKIYGDNFSLRPSISVYVSLSVFVSHLGRAVAWHTASNHDNAIRELRNSKPHLHRAIMDANKLLIEALFAPGFEVEKRQCGIGTTQFYLNLMEARCLEHDRLHHSDEEFNERVRKYKQFVLYPAEALLVRLSSNNPAHKNGKSC